MIPSIEQICEDLAAGRITVQQAIERLHQHIQYADLRDSFATAALQGILASSGNEALPADMTFQQSAARDAAAAYVFADAMLAERAKA